RLVTLGRGDREGDDTREARSILHWCLLFAKPGGWKQIRSYFVWCRLDGNSSDRHESLRVAIRPELLGQLGLRDLQELGQDRLADVAERYGCGQRCRAGRGGQRAIELAPQWLRGLLDAPGDSDGDRSYAHAQARENAVTLSPGKGTP